MCEWIGLDRAKKKKGFGKTMANSPMIIVVRAFLSCLSFALARPSFPLPPPLLTPFHPPPSLVAVAQSSRRLHHLPTSSLLSSRARSAVQSLDRLRLPRPEELLLQRHELERAVHCGR
jgi:hypothetical protein